MLFAKGMDVTDFNPSGAGIILLILAHPVYKM